MFVQIAELIEKAGLTGVSATMRPAADQQLYVTVSFMLPSIPTEKVWESKDDNAQRYIDLRTALSVPVVVTAKPEAILEKITATLAALSNPVIAASTAYNETDIAELLKNATAAKPAAKEKAATKTAAPKAKTSPVVADGHSEEEQPEQEENAGSDADFDDSRFSTFSSL